MRTMQTLSPLIHAAILPIGLAILVMSAPIRASQAGDTKKDAGATYTVSARTYKSGETNRYRLAIKIQTAGPMGDQDIAIQLRMKETAKSVRPSGEWSLVQQFEAGKLSLGGQEQDVLGMLPIVTLTRDKAGMVYMSTAGGTPDGAAEMGGLLLQVTNSAHDFAPDKSVKVGDKWKVSFANPSRIMGGVMVDAEAELLDTEMINGFKTLKIHFKGTTQNPTDTSAAPLEGVVNIDPQTGKLIRIAEKGEGTFAGGKAKADIEMTLAGKDDKAAKQ